MSVHVRVCTTIDASPATTWDTVERIDSHVEWMTDAESIRFTTASHAGVGTEFECVSRLGPVRLIDAMAVTEWRPREAMGIEHRGLVTGTGRFTLSRRRGERTRFCWDERLTFPWWMGGRVGEQVARPLFKRVWRGNLARLKELVERGAPT